MLPLHGGRVLKITSNCHNSLLSAVAAWALEGGQARGRWEEFEFPVAILQKELRITGKEAT